jgi:hypothetical protein
MPRPTEYENLIKTRALEAVQPTPGAVAGFLKNAANFLALSKALFAGTPLATEPMQVGANAYEGYHPVVQAVIRAHERRNDAQVIPVAPQARRKRVAPLRGDDALRQQRVGEAPPRHPMGNDAGSARRKNLPHRHRMLVR